MTREHVKNVSGESLGKDVKSLVTNSPWWILNGVALLSNFFNTVRGATAAYYFKDYVSGDAFLDFGAFTIVLYAGLFLMIGEARSLPIIWHWFVLLSSVCCSSSCPIRLPAGG